MEHLERDWKQCLSDIIDRTEKRALITVPSGRLYPIDRNVEHQFHFNRKMIDEFLSKRSDIKYKIRFWGFPFHVLYKWAINLNPELVSKSFIDTHYNFFQKFVSEILYWLFFFSIPVPFETNQTILVIDKKKTA